MKPVSIAYVPGPKFLGAGPFMRNIHAWRHHYPLILFSDHPWGGDIIPLKQSPEAFRDPDRWFAISNILFETAVLGILGGTDYTHMIYLESDCRVAGHDWDKAIIDETFSDGADPMAAGTLVAFNMSSRDMNWTRLWHRFMARHVKRQFPICCYGGGGAADVREPVMYPNGALGVYNLEFIRSMFENPLPDFGKDDTAWDILVGRHLQRRFGAAIFNGLLRHLDCIYSGYGEVQTLVNERVAWLREGKCVAVHQVKGETEGPCLESDLEPSETTNNRREPTDSPTVPITLDGGGAVEGHSKIANDKGALWLESTTAQAGRRDGKSESTVKECASGSGIKPGTSPSMSLFIVSYAKDAEWTWFCLASIAKFATGFKEVVVAVPEADIFSFASHRDHFTDVKFGTFDEQPGKGMLHHMAIECMADEFCSRDLVAHIDADCVFVKPVTPADYLVGGKPVLCIEPYALLKKTHPGRYGWKKCVDAAIGGQARFETMVRHPAVHWRKTYEQTRALVEAHTGKKFLDYVLSCKPDYPQGFAEYPTLGAVALKFFKDDYHFIDVSKELQPDNLLVQSHSHSGLDAEFNYNDQGIPFVGAPRKFYTQALGLTNPRYIPTSEEAERMAQ